jgi:hypothetical protein
VRWGHDPAAGTHEKLLDCLALLAVDDAVPRFGTCGLPANVLIPAFIAPHRLGRKRDQPIIGVVVQHRSGCVPESLQIVAQPDRQPRVPEESGRATVTGAVLIEKLVGRWNATVQRHRVLDARVVGWDGVIRGHAPASLEWASELREEVRQLGWIDVAGIRRGLNSRFEIERIELGVVRGGEGDLKVDPVLVPFELKPAVG